MSKESEIIQKDIDALYLGNLKTVEFDLKLPVRGQYGSEIEWRSEHERFLSPTGKVTRPMHGVGDRKVLLHAIFRYGEEECEKVYEVNILEEPDETKIEEVIGITRKCAPGKQLRLPQSVVVKNSKGQFLSVPVTWSGGLEKEYPRNGVYQAEGDAEGTALKAKAAIYVEEDYSPAVADREKTVRDFIRGEVELLPGSVFYNAEQRDLEVLLRVDPDQLLYNFRTAAGLDTKKAPPMTGWDSPECQLRGHTTGHYLSALALGYRETKEDKIKEKIDYLVQGLGVCQDTFSKTEGFEEGYIGGYSEEQFDLLEQGVKYPEIWAPYYTLHKILAGLLDCWYYAKNRQALAIAAAAGKWVYRRLERLGNTQRARMWNTYIAGEFGGINETMARLYNITREECYLECAHMFDNDKLFLPLEEGIDALGGLHANQHIPQIVGCMEIFKATGEKRYYDIAKFFWKAVSEAHIYANGGTGESEMFNVPDCIGEKLTKDTTESCATYNMLKLTKELYQYEPKAYYMDYYERAVQNHMAGTFDHELTGESTYFYPMEPGAQREFLFENSCCHGTGLESQMKYTESIYFEDEDSVYINLFIASNLQCIDKKLEIEQQVEESSPEQVTIKVMGSGASLSLKIRRPYWSKGEPVVKLNGENINVPIDTNGYLVIEQNWLKEELQIYFPCELRIERAKDRTDLGTFAYGPYVFAEISDNKEFRMLPAAGDRVWRKVRDTYYACKKEKEVSYLQLEINGRTWIPVCHIRNEKYHVYEKIS